MVVFDLVMLEKFDGWKVVMEIFWIIGKLEFFGFYLCVVFVVVGVSGKKFIVKVLNDYVFEVFMEDVDKFDMILVVWMNGMEMLICDKGLVFFIYFFDKDYFFYNEKYFLCFVW